MSELPNLAKNDPGAALLGSKKVEPGTTPIKMQPGSLLNSWMFLAAPADGESTARSINKGSPELAIQFGNALQNIRSQASIGIGPFPYINVPGVGNIEVMALSFYKDGPEGKGVYAYGTQANITQAQVSAKKYRLLTVEWLYETSMRTYKAPN